MESVKKVIMVNSDKHDVSYVLQICAVAALGGFLFGYDTSVISGAIEPIKEYFSLSDAETGWAVSSVVFGCIFGAFTSGWLAYKLGRRGALIICAVLFAVQSVGAALAPTFLQFIIYRILGGVAVGISSAISPMYMSEVSPKDMRGRALTMEQFAIVVGALCVYIVNYIIASHASAEWLRISGWRWMLGSEAIPCFLFCATVFFIPESPRWHVIHGRNENAFETLKRISNERHAHSLLQEIKASIALDGNMERSLKTLKGDKSGLWIILLGIVISALQQITGINIVVYYAPSLLKGTSDSIQTALFETIWIGVANLVGCIIGAWVVDRKGRKPLIKWGSIGMMGGLLVASWALYAQIHGVLALFGLLLFMVSFGFSWGPVTWVLVSEIFPNRIRSVGMSLAVAANWTMNFIVAQSFPMLAGNAYLNEHFHGAFSMWIFAVFCIIAIWFVRRFVSETNGVSLEKIENTIMESAPGFFKK